MVNALIQIDAETNRILNTVKAANGLRDKGKAVEYIAKQYAEKTYIAFDHDGRQFKPAFVKRVLDAQTRMERGEGAKFESAEAFSQWMATLRTADRTGSTKNSHKTRATSARTPRTHRKKDA
jgi:hypothetical protein